jgi:hypothetical protein
VVPDDGSGTAIEVEGVVAEKLDDGQVRLDLTARVAGEKILGMARATVRLS